jgi:hypothetical protein
MLPPHTFEATEMVDDYFGVVESPGQVPVNRLVDESPEMASIREAIDNKGLEPIWATLIAQFGALMYTRGRLSTSPLFRPVRVVSKKRDELENLTS